MSEFEAKLLIYEAFVENKVKGIPKHLLGMVHKLYFETEFDEFEEQNLWSLSNAFTSSFKQLNPVKRFEMTARFGEFMNSVRGISTGALSSRADADFGSLTPKSAGAIA